MDDLCESRDTQLADGECSGRHGSQPPVTHSEMLRTHQEIESQARTQYMSQVGCEGEGQMETMDWIEQDREARMHLEATRQLERQRNATGSHQVSQLTASRERAHSPGGSDFQQAPECNMGGTARRDSSGFATHARFPSHSNAEISDQGQHPATDSDRNNPRYQYAASKGQSFHTHIFEYLDAEPRPHGRMINSIATAGDDTTIPSTSMSIQPGDYNAAPKIAFTPLVSGDEEFEGVHIMKVESLDITTMPHGLPISEDHDTTTLQTLDADEYALGTIALCGNHLMRSNGYEQHLPLPITKGSKPVSRTIDDGEEDFDFSNMSVRMSAKNNNAEGAAGSGGAPEPNYAQLLYRCLKEAPEHIMSVQGIYDWVAQHSRKAKGGSERGWQNSIRYNLSVNAAFEPIANSGSPAPKRDPEKNNLWRLSDDALKKGLVSTARYCKLRYGSYRDASIGNQVRHEDADNSSAAQIDNVGALNPETGRNSPLALGPSTRATRFTPADDHTLLSMRNLSVPWLDIVSHLSTYRDLRALRNRYYKLRPKPSNATKTAAATDIDTVTTLRAPTTLISSDETSEAPGSIHSAHLMVRQMLPPSASVESPDNNFGVSSNGLVVDQDVSHVSNVQDLLSDTIQSGQLGQPPASKARGVYTHWAHADEEKLISMRDRGSSWSDIAAQLNRTVASAKQRYRKITTVRTTADESAVAMNDTQHNTISSSDTSARSRSAAEINQDSPPRPTITESILRNVGI